MMSLGRSSRSLSLSSKNLNVDHDTVGRTVTLDPESIGDSLATAAGIALVKKATKKATASARIGDNSKISKK